MPRIPQSLIDEILARTDFVAVLGQYISLRPQGRKFLALCPFHHEKTPSLNIDPDQGLWHCFGCKAGGNVVKFVMQMENIGFNEALRELGRRVGIEVDELTPEQRQAQEHRSRLRDIVSRAASIYHDLLRRDPQAAAARAYLEGRGIGGAVIELFQLGYAPPGPCYLMDRLKALHYTPDELREAGMATDATRSGRTVDILRDRVTFPILDAHGQAIAMGGRLMGDGHPKYLNSPESPLFSKRGNLYGLYQARSTLRHEPAILVEGYMDVVSLHQAGLSQAVASLGTALTPDQAHLVRRYCASCVLAYDADTAGQAATERGIEIFEKEGLAVRVVTMQPGDDPDSLVRREGPEAFRRRLQAAQGIVEYRMDALSARLDLATAEGRSAFLREMMATLAGIRDLVRLDHYIRLLSDKAGVREETVRALARSHLPAPAFQFAPPKPDWRKGGSRGGGRGSGKFGDRPRGGTGFAEASRWSPGGSPPWPGGEPEPFPPPPAESLAVEEGAGAPVPASDRVAERNLLRFLLRHPQDVRFAREQVGTEQVTDPLLRRLLQALYEQLDRVGYVTPEDVSALSRQEAPTSLEGVDKRISELLLDEESEPLTPQLFAGLLKSFQVRRDRAELESLRTLVEQKKHDGPIRHDDPVFLRIQELYQRLKGST